MTDAERTNFAEMMNGLCATFRVEPTRPLLDAYWLALRGLSLADFTSGCENSLSMSIRMPVPAELRNLAGAVTIAAASMYAWRAVRRAIQSHGPWDSLDFGPHVNATIRMLGGLQRLSNEDSDQMDKWVVKEFERVYTQLAASGVTQEMGRHLAGTHEIGNGAIGHAFDPPVRVALTSQPTVKVLEAVHENSTPRAMIEGVVRSLSIAKDACR